MRKRRGNAGVSLVELSLAITMVAVGLLGSTAALFGSVRLDESVRQRREVERTVLSLTERIRATPFDEIGFAWSDSTEDLVVNGASTTATFEVAQIEADTTAPLMEVRIRIADPGGGSTPLFLSTVYVSRHPTVEPAPVDGDTP